MANAVQGAFQRFYVDDSISSGTGQQDYESGGSGEIYEYLSESLVSSRDVLDTGGIRGVRAMPKERRRRGIRSVGGTITMNPSPVDLDAWLPRVMGLAGSGAGNNTFEFGETFTPFGVFLSRNEPSSTTGFEYTDCKISRTTFRGQAGALVEMSIDIIGGDEFINVTAPGTAPTLGVTSADEPYVFHDAASAFNLNDSTLNNDEMFDMEIVIDNVMDARFVNEVTTTSIVATDRIVTLGVTVPWDSQHRSLYRLSTTGTGGDITFTNGSASLKFTFVSLDATENSPVVSGKQEITQRLDYIARGTSGSSNELIITSVNA